MGRPCSDACPCLWRVCARKPLSAQRSGAWVPSVRLFIGNLTAGSGSAPTLAPFGCIDCVCFCPASMTAH